MPADSAVGEGTAVWNLMLVCASNTPFHSIRKIALPEGTDGTVKVPPPYPRAATSSVEQKPPTASSFTVLQRYNGIFQRSAPVQWMEQKTSTSPISTIGSRRWFSAALALSLTGELVPLPFRPRAQPEQQQRPQIRREYT